MGTWSYTRRPKANEICTAATPWKPDGPDRERMVHPDAQRTGAIEGSWLKMKCPNCGLEFWEDE